MRTQTATTTQTPARTIERVLAATSEHWVGDGFRVRSVIAPQGDPRIQSPFLLLDHAARRYFEPAAEPRGVGEHPHRGFETVTFAYRGEIEHRDSTGGGGTIGAGDVQWMTAAGGLVHEEFHSQKFTAEGGDMEMVQLWVNLPAKSKLTKPGYQALLDKDFPRLTLGAAGARLIAGSLNGEQGPARTHSPMTVFDLSFNEEGPSEFTLPSDFNSFIFTLEGDVRVGAEARPVKPGELAVLKRGESGSVWLQGAKGARVLVLSGEPLDEPVAAYGPFVMNTQSEIMEAIRDYQTGKMGHLPARG
ncbi:MAG TPA: pirin family protein [Polyangiales bacterium]|nr:pirin family protein [Polyangiales bacterium]